MATSMLNQAGTNQSDKQSFESENHKNQSKLVIIPHDDARMRAGFVDEPERDLPPVQPEDIKDIETLFKAAEAGQHIAFTENGGKTWRFAVVTSKFENTFQEGVWRYSVDVDLERTGPDFRHCSRVIVTRDFEPVPLRDWLPRMVIRPVSADQVAQIAFSYASQHKFARKS